RQPVVVIGPIHVVLDVFFAAPDHFHRSVYLLRDLDCEHGAVSVESPTEPSAQQMVVDLDGILRQASELRDHGLGQRWRLRADPDVTTILAEMDRAVHRLHCGMCQERKLIDRFDPLRREASAVSASPSLRATTPGCFEASSSWRMRLALSTVAFAPSSHWVAVALSPFLAAHMWSATTATASSIRTTWRTPFTESAAASFTDF